MEEVKNIFKEINEGKRRAYLETYKGRERIIAINPESWVIRTESGRTYYCTPQTKVFT